MSSIAATDNLLDWLRDAHAMEQQAEKMLLGMAQRLEHYDELRERIEQHVEETRGQQLLLKGCIDRLGSTTSLIKDMTAKITAFGQSLTGMPVSDEVIKGAMSCYVFEHMEIAAYTVLISAAREVGDIETERVCEKILPQEVAMAEWLRDRLPQLTHIFLARATADNKAAKR